MFQLTKKEWQELITICDKLGAYKFSPAIPMAFTEQGVAMLSGILRSPLAIEVNIAVMLYDVCDSIDRGFIGTNLVNQLIRSGTSAALNYAEAQSAESRKDFIHKTSIVLKELRESGYNLSIIQKSGIGNDQEKLSKALSESQELISIFYRSVETARKNAKADK